MGRSELTQAFYPLRTRADRRMDLEKKVNERIPENLYYGEFNFLDNEIEFGTIVYVVHIMKNMIII